MEDAQSQNFCFENFFQKFLKIFVLNLPQWQIGITESICVRITSPHPPFLARWNNKILKYAKLLKLLYFNLVMLPFPRFQLLILHSDDCFMDLAIYLRTQIHHYWCSVICLHVLCRLHLHRNFCGAFIVATKWWHHGGKNIYCKIWNGLCWYFFYLP